MKKNYVFNAFIKIGILILIAGFFVNCSEDKNNPIEPTKDAGSYSIYSTYDSIRSYPAGGGLFVVYIKPDSNFSGIVNLSVQSDAKLNAKLNKTQLKKGDTVVEITIKPDSITDIKNYIITLVTKHANQEKKKEFKIAMYEWSMVNFETAITNMDKFRDWLINQNPDYLKIFTKPGINWATYPQTLIVEHYTFLTDNYEVRLCYHVMIPPYDWSKICIRKRGNTNFEFSAIRETDGKISIYPVNDYPFLYGY
jgi:hypothetical protein